MAFDLLVILMFFAAGSGFIFLMLTVGRFFRPANPSPDKTETYECGERPIGEAWIQFNPRFYVIALVFVIFDVEVAFVFPVATVFQRYLAAGSGVLAVMELFVFMAVLLLGLIYVWSKGDLRWVKEIAPRRAS